MSITPDEGIRELAEGLIETQEEFSLLASVVQDILTTLIERAPPYDAEEFGKILVKWANNQEALINKFNETP